MSSAPKAAHIFSFFIWFAPTLLFPLEGARNHHFKRIKDAEKGQEPIDNIEKMNVGVRVIQGR